MATDKTIVIDNFSGRLTRYPNGSLNSGLAWQTTTHSLNQFKQPMNLSWAEQPTQIDAAGSVITDLIVAARARNESGTTYVYAVGHNRRVYKIQVNNTSTHNPSYNNPVLLTTLTNGQTFKYTSSIQFYGSTEKMFIGHDAGVTKLNFDGTGETDLTGGSWVTNVPRQSVQFIGSIFWTNGSNLAQIDSTETVINYGVLTPSFPTNMQARDIKASSDGRYIATVVTRNPQADITLTTPDTTTIASSESIIAYWNGVDLGVTSYTTITSFEQTAYHTFGQYQYALGYDIAGAIVSVADPFNKKLSLLLNESPLPQAVNSNGDLLGWATPEFDNGFEKASHYLYGALDQEVGVGFWRILRWPAQGTETDVQAIPVDLLVSNLTFGSSTSGYSGPIGLGLLYFSTLETSAGTTKYKLWCWPTVATGTGTAMAGVYQTQTQLFSKTQRINEIRFYMEPTVTNNGFQADIIGIDQSVITDTPMNYTFVAGSDPTIPTGSQTIIRFNPDMNVTPAIGLRITNTGTANMAFHKVEIDINESGR